MNHSEMAKLQLKSIDIYIYIYGHIFLQLIFFSVQPYNSRV